MSTTAFRTAGRRLAFTLIEMLVVIAIIAILASLLLVGVNAVWKKGPEAQTRSDLLNFKVALDNFKAKYKFYPPSQIKLHAKYSQFNAGNALDVQSITYLSAMFPNSVWTTNPNAQILWAGATPIPANGFVLEGDQCLVFFLAGIPNGVNAPLGFSNNATDPSTAGGDRIKFLTSVDASRMILAHPGSPFPSYLDPYNKMPYVYFSSNKNGQYDTLNPNTGTLPVSSLGVSPYILPTGTYPQGPYYNPNTIQIISAGLNLQFGSGGNWPPLKAIVAPSTNPQAGTDDMSNFSDKLLGSQ
jgi:prepilin-type N-terminal cleavage/methylation domain-containing protein